MADFATESANKVTQPVGAISGNAPPTPPETQEVKSANPTSTLPTTTDEPVKADEAPRDPASTSIPEPVQNGGEAGIAAPIASGGSATTTTVPGQAAESSLKTAETQADQLAAQPEKPSAGLSSSAPINAEATAGTDSTTGEQPKKSPKPVSLEEVSDPDGPATKPTVANDVVKPATTAKTTAPPAPEETEDVAMTDAQPSVATGPSKPEPIPAVSEPKTDEPRTGQKRKAPEALTANGEVSPDTNDTEAPAGKKQKSSPIKNAVNKVTAAVKKAGRPKKDKKQPPPVGKTARKTRSQGKPDEI
ncbi:hypothetical protein SCUP234_05503 [Seiridium cupressi]